MDVFCIGKTTIDQFLMLNQHTLKFHLDPKSGFISFRHGEKIDVDEFVFCLGGNATNVAVGLTRLGLAASLCSEIGDDIYSSLILDALEKEKVDRSHMIITKNSPSSFSIIINIRGERTIFMKRLEREHKFNFEDVSTNYVFLTSLEKEWQGTYRNVLALAAQKGCKLAFNPGTLQLQEGHELVRQVIEKTDILFVNKEEAEELVYGHEKRKSNNQCMYVKELLVKLQKLGARIVIVTNGKHGSHAIDGSGNFYYEGLCRGEVVERTGAGDAFTSGFLAAYIYQKSIKEALKWGSINAASVVGKVGAVAGLLARDPMEKREGEAEVCHVVQKRRLHPVLEYAMSKLRIR